MSATFRTREELGEDLAEATLRHEEIDAEITALGPDPDADKIADLNQRFAEQGKKVAFIQDAIDRRETMVRGKAEAPLSKDGDGAKPSPAQRVEVGGEPLTYRKEGVREPDGSYRSFFADALSASKGDVAAQARLARHTREMEVLGLKETRAITTSSGGPGLVPTQYFLDELATFARAGRPFADSLNSQPLPDSGISFSVPRVTTGATTAVHTEGSGVNDSSPVTDYLTFALNTIAGKVDSSRQLVDRSNPLADQIVGQDLAADYAKQLDTQLLNQATNGITVLSGTNGVTYTDATPTAGELYAKIADAVQQVWTQRFANPSLIVMHPRRWAFFLGAVDSQGRPLVLPDAMGAVQIFNAMAAEGAIAPQGLVGQIQGLPVVIDPNISTTLGAGTNQDVVVVTRREDHILAESAAPRIEVYEEVLSGNLQVRIMCWGYFAFTFARYAKATSIISGTGLVTPTF